MGIQHHRRRGNRSRAGATMVESAVALGVICLFLFGILDVGLALVRLNCVAEAARRVTRVVITHGTRCTPTQGTWGPTELVIHADASHSAAQAARPYLPAMNLAQTEIRLEWLDGDSLPDSRVRATVSTTHYSIALGLFSSEGFRISGQSTMRIAH